MIALEREFDFFVNNQKKLAKEYRGKYIAIKDNKVLGAFDSLPEAVRETSKHEEMGTFLIQKCGASEKAYTQTYHSRATFASK